MFDHTPCFCFRVFPTHWSQQISCSSRVINNSPSLSASLKGREHIPCQSATLSGQLLSFISSNHFFLTVAIKCQPKCVCIFSLPALCAAACVIYNQPKHFLKCTTTLCLSYCWVRSSTWETKTKRPLTHVPLETVLHNPFVLYTLICHRGKIRFSCVYVFRHTLDIFTSTSQQLQLLLNL